MGPVMTKAGKPFAPVHRWLAKSVQLCLTHTVTSCAPGIPLRRTSGQPNIDSYSEFCCNTFHEWFAVSVLVKAMEVMLGLVSGLAAAGLFVATWLAGDLHLSDQSLAIGSVAILLGLAPVLLRLVRGGVTALGFGGFRDRVSSTTFEKPADGQFVFDEAGILVCNDAALAMLGASRRDQVEGIHPARFSPEFQADGQRSAELAGQMVAAAIKDGYHRFEWTHCRLDGTIFEVLVTLVGIRINGRPLLCCYWQDITDRVNARRLEAAERQNAEARRARELAVGQEIATLIGGISKGDLSRRLDLSDKEGFYRSMSEGINALADTIDAVVADLAGVLAALARGDLTQRITKSYHGAFETVKNDVNATSARLEEIVSRIGEATDAIGQASAEVSAGSTDLAQRTEQQASSLEETAASIEELSATVRTSANTSQRANTMVGEARQAAEQGRVIADSAIEAMKRISEASRKITEIIGVSDEIAFQTNLLALNAAVEAARAGDAGKGFAVVAQEVRVLAQRSAQASKEIKTLILNSDHQVQSGVELVKKAGDSLTGIADGVRQVATLIGNIAAAGTEQATALNEINTAVAAMDEMTQKNAALVEETSAAAQAMADQADDLRAMMAFFSSTSATPSPAQGARRR